MKITMVYTGFWGRDFSKHILLPIYTQFPSKPFRAAFLWTLRIHRMKKHRTTWDGRESKYLDETIEQNSTVQMNYHLHRTSAAVAALGTGTAKTTSILRPPSPPPCSRRSHRPQPSPRRTHAKPPCRCAAIAGSRSRLRASDSGSGCRRPLSPSLRRRPGTGRGAPIYLVEHG